MREGKGKTEIRECRDNKIKSGKGLKPTMQKISQYFLANCIKHAKSILV